MGVNGIYGLSGSGLDVESMVKVGMMSKENQLTKMQQNYTKNEWKKEAYLEIYDKLQSYNLSNLSNYKRTEYMNARTATSSNDAIKVTANSSAPTKSHVISVDRTATSAYLNGTEKLTRTASGASQYSTKLADVLFSSYSITENDNGTYNATFNFSDGTSKEFSSASEADLKAVNALSFLVGADTDAVTAGAYANVSLTSTAFSSTNFKSTLQGIINDYADNEGYTSTQDFLTDYKDETALSISAADGTNSDEIEITFGELNEVLEKGTFQDFVALLNKKFSDSGVNLEASDDSNTLKISNTNASTTDTVSFVINSDGIGTAFNDAIKDGMTTAPTSGVTVDGVTFTENTTGMTGSSTTMLTLEASNGAAASVDTDEMKEVKITYYDLVKDASFYTLTNKVGNTGTGVKAYYDSAQDTFSFYNQKSGSSSYVAIQANDERTATLLTNMGLKATDGGADLSNAPIINFAESDGNDGYKAKITAGKDASVTIDGIKQNPNANNITVQGVTYDFSQVTKSETATVNVDQDVDKIMDNVKSFVKEYNELMEGLYTAYSERPNSGYEPLTEAQKAEMTEEQIEKWEKKAKAGLLYHDSTLRRIIEQMRSAVSGTVDGMDSGYKYTTAYSIGISSKGVQGQLQIDEERLRAALVDDPDSVYKIFANLDSTKDDVTDSANGIAQRLGGVLSNATKSISKVSGTNSGTAEDSTLNTLLRNLQTKMSNFQAMMQAFEDKLYKKYDAMESSLAMLGSQLNYVTGMFSS
ncbi:MAG: flagellar filament capping protein FliD [Selenomonadaceae bacterium]|nr:flagellar filament capping protein FliD [Selenomonadaceae bacterium]